jgi:hypothetical protein
VEGREALQKIQTTCFLGSPMLKRKRRKERTICTQVLPFTNSDRKVERRTRVSLTYLPATS